MEALSITVVFCEKNKKILPKVSIYDEDIIK